MRTSNFALRMPPLLMTRAKKVAKSQGVSMNQLINMAVAQVASTLDAAEYFRERGQRADRNETLKLLARAGAGNPPKAGDELPQFSGRRRRQKPIRSKDKKKRLAA
jgi:hypothetical protein